MERDIAAEIAALDARIGAIAAFVAALPDAGRVDIARVKETFRLHRPVTDRPFGKPPSPSSAASSAVDQIAKMTASNDD